MPPPSPSIALALQLWGGPCFRWGAVNNRKRMEKKDAKKNEELELSTKNYYNVFCFFSLLRILKFDRNLWLRFLHRLQISSFVRFAAEVLERMSSAPHCLPLNNRVPLCWELRVDSFAATSAALVLKFRGNIHMPLNDLVCFLVP